jgi:hypothetical protein
MYVAYVDEASFNYGLVRGVGMASAPVPETPVLASEVRALLDASEVGECKWEKIRSARTRFAAEKLLTWTIEATLARRLRVDMLTWDAGQRAGSGAGTPYLAMLRRMYARLVDEILPQRWPPGSAYVLYPDEQAALNWERLVVGIPHITSAEPRPSDAEPLIQIADLFSGLGVYSRGSYAIYQRWLCYSAAERAADLRQAALPFSASDRIRCHLLNTFFTLSKYHRLGISLRTHGGLRTYGAAYPICFWWG